MRLRANPPNHDSPQSAWRQVPLRKDQSEAKLHNFAAFGNRSDVEHKRRVTNLSNSFFAGAEASEVLHSLWSNLWEELEDRPTNCMHNRATTAPTFETIEKQQ
jgi:hypothetical protein